ncbi:MAG: hypothetical protein ACJ74O_20710 [Frankiaceae bacterium]
MPRRYSVRRSVTALLAVVALPFAGLSTGLSAAQAAPTASGPGSGDATVVLLLRPANPGALGRLAASRSASFAERTATLRAAAPAAASRERAEAWLAAHGLTVTGRSPWALTATAPAATAASAFGVTAVRTGGRLSHRGTLRSPAALAGVVDGVVGLDDRAVLRRLAPMPRPDGTLGAEELHDAYGADPTATGAGTTVATLQFAGWNQSDLTDYATAAGLTGADPAALHPYMDTSQRSSSRAPADGSGDFEVALDQESLLATAPGAAQRIYFAENTPAGFELALTKLLTDIWGGQPVTALSISWGACEQDFAPGGDTGQLTTIEQTLENLTAAGVTIFAASGDSGSYDCGQVLSDGSPNPAAGQLSVDFPGSSPVVVAVGGTRLTHTDGSWRETAWGPAWPAAGRTVGTGGGYSTQFDRPAWQVGIGGQFTTTKRAVPDIASAADPRTGFGVYEKRLCGVTAWCLGGGTSAGAPAQAGLFVSALAAAGRTSGIGDAHAVLYGNTGAFRDITAGSNGTYPTGFGWDPVTGLGSPRWSALGPQLLAPALVAPVAVATPAVPVDASVPAGTTVASWQAGEGPSTACSAGGGTTAPTTIPIAASGDRATAVSFGAATDSDCLGAAANVLLDTVAPTPYATLTPYDGLDARLSPSWGTLTDGPAPSWAGQFSVRLRRYRDGRVVWTGTRGTTGKQTVTMLQGAAYRLEVQETDRAGNTGDWEYSPYVVVPWDGTHFTYSSGWRHQDAASAFGGRIAGSATKRARTMAHFTGSSLAIVAYTTPSSGSVYVNVDGHYVSRVRLYTRTGQWRHVIPVWHGSPGQHVVMLTNTGGHAAASTGTWTWIDAIAVQ